jgi:hypothetical protein
MKILMTAALGVTLLAAQSANAQQATTPPCDENSVAVPAPRGETVTTKYMPHPVILTVGSIMLVGAYIPSAIVAATSGFHDPDEKLYWPVAGPWIDLAERGGCPEGRSCNTETWNKVLLIGDGILQGVGALAVVSSFFIPMTTKEHREAAKPSVHVLPMQVGGGASLGAGVVGKF